jgi:uncharacterized protein
VSRSRFNCSDLWVVSYYNRRECGKTKIGGWTLQDKLGLLRELQGLDRELVQLNEGRQKLEAEIAKYQDELARVQEMVDSLADEMEAIQAERRELLRAQAQEAENVQRAEGRLPSIKTQKEYIAVLKEIDSAKAVSRDIQGKLAAKEAELENLGRDREEKEQETSGIREKFQARQAEIDAQLAETDGAVTDMNQRKNVLLEQIPVPIRKRYQMLLERRGGIAVVEARKGACSGCNMHLPPQLYNSLFRMQEIQSCPHCNRLLYVLPDQL